MTIVNENDNAILFEGNRFSWSAAFAGAFVATAVSFFLLALGSGFGLALVSNKTAVPASFLTLGAIYFLAAQAFGFAAGGHIAGRLIGPMPETAKEENFRSAAHGLVVWALAVVVTAVLVAIGALAAGTSPTLMAAVSPKTESAALQPAYVSYWVDMLFRPGPGPSQASLAWRQYAQASTGNATDASPMPNEDNNATQTPMTQMDQAPASSAPRPLAPAQTEPSDQSPAATPSQPVTIMPSGPASGGVRDTQIPPQSPSFVPPASLSADKAEATTIIEVGMKDGARLNQYDKDRLAALVAQDTGLGVPEAQRRVDNAEMRINKDQTQTMDTARKTASYASLWIALALFFGAIVSMMAAASARWTDDRVTFGWPRREPG